MAEEPIVIGRSTGTKQSQILPRPDCTGAHNGKQEVVNDLGDFQSPVSEHYAN